jgi:hypothetical protein
MAVYSGVARVRVVRVYELELRVEAWDEAEARERLEWMAMGFAPLQVEEHVKVSPSPVDQLIESRTELDTVYGIEDEDEED